VTAAGIGGAVWAAMRLNNGTLPNRQAIYYIALGLGVLLIGNLVWRMICEFWLLLFNIHGLLASIADGAKPVAVKSEPDRPVIKETARSQSTRPDRAASVAGPHSVLGLSS